MTINIHVLPELNIYINTGVSYNIIAEDSEYFLVRNHIEYLIIDKKGWIKSRFSFEISKDVIDNKNYLHIDKINNPAEYEYWFNPAYIIYKNTIAYDKSLNKLRIKEFSDKVEIYSYCNTLSNSKEIKFTLNLNNKLCH